MRFSQIIVKNKRDSIKLLFLIALYVIPLLAIITWGIPNPNHPFAYHMDEWHQLQAVKSVFKHFSNNIEGAAHGPMFQFLLTGLYLIPFYLLGVVNPFVISSSVDALSAQKILFILLRMNTLLFGVLSLITLYIIAKKYLRINPVLTCLLFLVTPIWLMLSNYFKYDIALVFWILFSLLGLLRYRDHPTLKNFFIGCSICALGVATKISALPLVPIFVLAFFLFTPDPKKHLKWLGIGMLYFSFIFCLVGIPDILTGRGDYREFLYDNLISSPERGKNLMLDSNEFVYLFFRVYPVLFGHGLFLLIILCVGYWIFNFKMTLNKTGLFLFFSFILFFISLITLKLSATGNRSLVLLLFFALFCSITFKSVGKRYSRFVLLANSSIVLILVLQLLESSSLFTLKLFPDPRQVSSVWIKSNVPRGSVIGLENVPIYQMVPDVIVKDYYTGQYKTKTKTSYSYQIVNSKTNKLPEYIIISNGSYETKYLKKSSKKDLLARVKKEKYEKIAKFSPDRKYYYLFNNELNHDLSSLIPSVPINIYKKKIQ